MLIIEEPHAPIEAIQLKKIETAGVELFIKREDLSNPFISGNKWRKLKYHLFEAHKIGFTKLVTFGGAYSNHVLATAAAGAKYKFGTTAIIRGEEVQNPILNLCKLFGMQLIFISRETYKNKENWAAGQQFKECYFIPEGGGGELGEKGIAELVSKWDYDHIFCSVGTGSTLKGLLTGMIQQHNHGIVNGIVVLKGAEEMRKDFECFPQHNYRLHFNYHEGGYAKTSTGLMQFIKEFATETGVLLDQVYEAKMMKALIDMIDKGYFMEGQRILALHNGGLSGLLSQL
jgi:1-aminocyclopropane-1-carboxylate deaminase